MNNTCKKLLVAMGMLPFCLFGTAGDGDSFKSYLNTESSSNDMIVNVSGEALYFGWSSDLVEPSYSPGFRINSELYFPKSHFNVFANYFDWSSEDSIQEGNGEIDFEQGIKGLIVAIGAKWSLSQFAEFNPYLGMERNKLHANITSELDGFQLSQENDLAGPILGFWLKSPLYKYVHLVGGVSASYLTTNYNEKIHQIIDGEKLSFVFANSYDIPKSMLSLGLEFSIPINKKNGLLKIRSGYEKQHFWTNLVREEFRSKRAITFEGFTGELSLQY